jgi:predicted GH43/DUF377 family glycosyl hydrolase
MLKNIILQFIPWLKNLFSKNTKQICLKKDIIGTARFGKEVYFFLREGNHIFLISNTKIQTYRQKIKFSPKVNRYVPTMKDLDAITLSHGEHAMVCTIKFGKKYKTLYFVSEDTIHFKASSMVENPNGSPTKVITHGNNEIALLTSIQGEICYRKLDLNHREIHYHNTTLVPRNDSFDHSPLSVVSAFNIPDGIFVIYDTSYEMRGFQTHRFGAALLAHGNLKHTHWRAFFDEIPFWDHFVNKKSDKVMNLSALGAYLNEDMIKVYFYEQNEKNIYTLDLHEPYARRNPHPEKALLKKYVNNPIIKPNPNNNWENHTTFNPTAIQIDDVTHLLYRAEGSAGLSVIGYGKSHNGVTFDRLADPIYVPRMDFEGVNMDSNLLKTMRRVSFKSGYRHYPEGRMYDWHGVEDPRITELDGRLYMIYAAFNGYQYARPAITSIDKQDFLDQKWDWTTPQLMTEQVHHWGAGNKNVVLHPEKVDGKYMLYHRMWPHIRIDMVDDLEFGPGIKYLKEIERIEARGDSWDSNRVGVSAPPLLIDEGWLLIYQGSGSQDKRYKVGAMILDKNDPSKVLYRSGYPILVPSESYEGGIAYVCGAVIRDEILYIYYGANDKYVCTASAPVREFVEKLKLDPYYKPELQKNKNIKDLCI